MNIDFDHYRGSEIADEILVTLQEQRQLEIINKLNPTLGKEGNEFWYLYGSNPTEGVTGFGETVELAVIDFCKNYRTHKA